MNNRQISLTYTGTPSIIIPLISSANSPIPVPINPEEKSIATSTTNVTKILASSVGPTIAGRVLLLTAFSPFVIGGFLKIIYDIILYFNFRNLKPPEEKN